MCIKPAINREVGLIARQTVDLSSTLKVQRKPCPGSLLGLIMAPDDVIDTDLPRPFKVLGRISY